MISTICTACQRRASIPLARLASISDLSCAVCGSRDIDLDDRGRGTAVTAAEDVNLYKLKPGDPVTVVMDGREHQMTVRKGLQPGDYAYEPGGGLGPAGSPIHANVSVTFGPGRYSTEISVAQQHLKSPYMPYIKSVGKVVANDVPDAATWGSDVLRLNIPVPSRVVEDEHSPYETPPADGSLPGVEDRVWSNPGDPEETSNRPFTGRHREAFTDLPLGLLNDTNAVAEIVSCSNCGTSFRHVVTDPAEPLPPCPNCGGPTSVAGATNTQAVGKLDQIARGVLTSNPGMTSKLAYELARRTLDRYPKVAEMSPEIRQMRKHLLDHGMTLDRYTTRPHYLKMLHDQSHEAADRYKIDLGHTHPEPGSFTPSMVKQRSRS